MGRLIPRRCACGTCEKTLADVADHGGVVINLGPLLRANLDAPPGLVPMQRRGTSPWAPVAQPSLAFERPPCRLWACCASHAKAARAEVQAVRPTGPARVGVLL
jgi:hypothetical protein